jgi:hypothetical protein
MKTIATPFLRRATVVASLAVGLWAPAQDAMSVTTQATQRPHPTSATSAPPTCQDVFKPSSDPNDADGLCTIEYGTGGTKPPIDVCFVGFNFDALECLTEVPAYCVNGLGCKLPNIIGVPGGITVPLT